MTRTSIINGGAIALALVASVLMAARRAPAPSAAGDLAVPRGVAEAHRIVSVSTLADRLLLDLCSPERLIAFTERSTQGRDGHRFAGRPTVRALDDIERIVSLAPDLVLTHNVADARRVQRLRDAGLRVVDLGGLDGVRSLVDDAVQIGAICGVPEAGERYGRTFERRMQRVASGITERRGAIYLSLYADRLFGGTVGSSYHDVLTAAGLRDMAEGRFRGFPQYAIEQVLGLDPELIVTRQGMASALCSHPALGELRACPGGMIEIDGDLLDDPGPGMLDAAEEIREAAYPR